MYILQILCLKSAECWHGSSLMYVVDQNYQCDHCSFYTVQKQIKMMFPHVELYMQYFSCLYCKVSKSFNKQILFWTYSLVSKMPVGHIDSDPSSVSCLGPLADFRTYSWWRWTYPRYRQRAHQDWRTAVGCAHTKMWSHDSGRADHQDSLDCPTVSHNFIFCWPCISLQILGNIQLDTLFHVFIYFMSLHVLSVAALIIRRSNCINTSSGMISLCKWLLGMPVRREL